MTARRDDAAARLAALLDRLTAELTDATDAEVEAALSETGRVRAAALREVRALLSPDTHVGVPDEVGLMTDTVPTANPMSRH